MSSTDPDSVIALVMVDSKTGFLGCVPMNSKAQFDLATKELIAFCQTLGYNEVMLRCDNEPSVLQLQRLVVQARQQMGLQTKACTPRHTSMAMRWQKMQSSASEAWLGA